jgi:hypothetical protein
MVRHFCLSLLLALLPAVAADAAPPEAVQKDIEQALRLVPHDASGFLVINQFNKQVEKLRTLEKKLELGKEGESLVDRMMKDCPVDPAHMRGSVLAVFLEPRGEAKEPGVVFLLSVEDHKKLLNDLGAKPPEEGISQYTTKGGHSGLIAARDNYTLLTASPDDRDSLRYLLKSEKNITQQLQVKPQWLAQWDVVGVATPEGWKNHFNHLMEARPRGADANKEGAEKKPEERDASGFTAVVQKNIGEIAVAGHIHEEGHIQLATRLFLKKDSPYVNLIGQDEQAAKTLSLLEGLPDEPYIFACGGRAPHKVQQQFFATFREMIQSALARSEDLNEEQRNEWNRLMGRADNLQARVESMTFLLRRGEPRAVGMPQNLSGTLQVKDARTFVKDGAGWVESAYQLAQRQAPDRAPKMKYTRQQPGSDGASGEVLSWESEDGKGNNCHLILQAMDESTVVYLLHAGPNATADQGKELVRKYQKGETSLARNKGVARAASLLPETAHGVAFLDLVPIVQLFFGFAANAEKIEQEGSVPLGYATSVLPDGAELHVVLPLEMMQQLAPMMRQAWQAVPGTKRQEGKEEPQPK